MATSSYPTRCKAANWIHPGWIHPVFCIINIWGPLLGPKSSHPSLGPYPYCQEGHMVLIPQMLSVLILFDFLYMLRGQTDIS